MDDPAPHCLAAVERGAVLSDDAVYRYRLWRRWSFEPAVLFVMLNPSTADALDDDRTIGRCCTFARTWGYGGIEVVNLFGLRSVHPRALAAHPDPVGPDNAQHLEHAIAEAGLVVAAWGASWPKAHACRVAAVTEQLQRLAGHRLHHLGLTLADQPRHPLFLLGSTLPQTWAPAALAA